MARFMAGLLGVYLFSGFFVVNHVLAADEAAIVGFSIGDENTVKELTLLNRVKDLALGVLSWILAPVAGAFTTWKGWQMIGQAERGDKGPGIVVFLCGIGMFALGRIVQEVLTALQG